MFYKLPLTTEQVASGVLFRITDAIDAEFNNSARAILQDGMIGDQEEMLILFDNRTLDSGFSEQNPGLMEMLYCNEAAKDAIVRAKVDVKFDGEVDKAPEGGGLMCRMYRFVNLRKRPML